MITAADLLAEIEHRPMDGTEKGQTINKDNSPDFEELLNGYCSGAYDDDRELLIQRLVHLINKEI